MIRLSSNPENNRFTDNKRWIRTLINEAKKELESQEIPVKRRRQSPIKHINRKDNLSEYNTWFGAMSRCTNPKNKAYRNYGGRGITLCDRWLKGSEGISGFDCFLADMGKRPHKNLTIDRINNDLGYSPENCQWATKTQQAINRRNCIWVMDAGERKNLAQALRDNAITKGSFHKVRKRTNWREDLVIAEILRKRKLRKRRRSNTKRI